MASDDSAANLVSGQPDQSDEAGPVDEMQPVEQIRKAARAVMHPDPSDPEWRYYHGAWHS